MKSDFIQGDEWGTYVALDTSSTERNAGSPTGRESYGDGTLVVVRDGESPSHGEGG
jgi:hypothetical protein